MPVIHSREDSQQEYEMVANGGCIERKIYQLENYSNPWFNLDSNSIILHLA